MAEIGGAALLGGISATICLREIRTADVTGFASRQGLRGWQRRQGSLLGAPSWGVRVDASMAARMGKK